MRIRFNLKHPVVLICAGLMLAASARAQTAVTFPIPELGACQSKEECHAYCEQMENRDACAAFAKAHGLAKKENPERSDKLSRAIQSGGPGGCVSRDACKVYCDVLAHLDECVRFAKEHGLTGGTATGDSGDKIAAAVQQGIALPGGCQDRQTCQVYCQDSAHREECLAFSRSVGLLPPPKPVLPPTPAPRMPQSTGELKECLVQSLGEETVQELQSGILRPDALMQRQIRVCVMKFNPALTPPVAESGTDQPQPEDSEEPEVGILPVPPKLMPPFQTNPGTKACLEKLYGPDIFAQIQSGGPTAEMKEKIGACLGASVQPVPIPGETPVPVQ